MEQEIDVTPRHLFDWLKADLVQDGPRRLLVRATREYVAEVSPAACDGLDAEDGFVVAITVGLLEVTPASGHPHWVLRLRVEDAIGTHLPENGSAPEGPEEIGLAEFERCFLASDAWGEVTLETASAAGGRGFERLYSRILADRHRGVRAAAPQPAAGSRMA